MWRDPLDELIEQLEVTLPPTKPTPAEDLPRLYDLQRAGQIIMYGTDEDRARLDSEPWFQEVRAQMAARMARARGEEP